MKYKLRYMQYSERSILVQWPDEINQNVLNDLLCFKKSIENHYDKLIIEVISGYNSLLISYMSTIEDVYGEFDLLKSIYLQAYEFKKDVSDSKLWKIPVCYSESLAPDLRSFAEQKKMSIADVITLHTTPVYKIYFMGFLPGFLYLGGLNEKLILPRKKSPAKLVKKGAVAIGGNQTGIYPVDSPGGWHVIGQSPLSFFDVNNVEPTPFRSNDCVKFISITESIYNDIGYEVNKGNYHIDYEIL